MHYTLNRMSPKSYNGTFHIFFHKFGVAPKFGQRTLFLSSLRKDTPTQNPQAENFASDTGMAPCTLFYCLLCCSKLEIQFIISDAVWLVLSHVMGCKFQSMHAEIQGLKFTRTRSTLHHHWFKACWRHNTCRTACCHSRKIKVTSQYSMCSIIPLVLWVVTP